MFKSDSLSHLPRKELQSHSSYQSFSLLSKLAHWRIPEVCNLSQQTLSAEDKATATPLQTHLTLVPSLSSSCFLLSAVMSLRIVFAKYMCKAFFSSHPFSSFSGGVSCRCGPSLREPGLQPSHGQLGPGPAGADANRLRQQRDRALLLVLGPQRQPGLRRRQMRQVQRWPASAVPSARGHVWLVLPSPQHLVAVGRAGGGRDGATGPGGGVLLHASHLGVSLTETRCHDPGEVKGFWEDMEDAAVLRQELQRHLWVSGGGKRHWTRWSHMYL